NAGDLAKRRVRLLRRHRPNLQTDATLLGRASATGRPLVERVIVKPQRRSARLLPKLFTSLADELTDGRQRLLHRYARLLGLPGNWAPTANYTSDDAERQGYHTSAQHGRWHS